jgi:Uncharacterised protein family UPF0547
MPLIGCPECGRQISTAAEACPHCGHPNRPPKSAAGPPCYACALPATTRCQRCGALSCAQHLQSIYVPHGQGGAYELRCQRCYSSAVRSKTAARIAAGILFLLLVLFLLGYCARS